MPKKVATGKKSEAVVSQSQGNGSRQKGADSNGGSSFSLWLIIFLITAGTGAGFYFGFEEMKSANEALVAQISSISKELDSISEFKNEASKMAEGIKSISAMQDSIKNIQLKQNDIKGEIGVLSEKLGTLQRETTDQRSQTDMLQNEQSEAKQMIQNIDKKMTTSNEILSQDLKDYNAVFETNMEGIAKDISRLSDFDQTLTDKTSKFESSIESMDLLIKNLNEKIKQMETGFKAKNAETETLLRKIETYSSDQISVIQQSTAKQVSDLTQQVVESKQISQNLQTSVQQLNVNMKSEVSAAMGPLITELQEIRESSKSVTRKQTEIDEEIRKIQLKIVTDQEVNTIKEEISTLADQTSKTAAAYNGVQSAIAETSDKIEKKIATLNAHVRAAKDDVAVMRDNVKSMNDAVTEIRSLAGQAKNAADTVENKLNTLQSQTAQGNAQKKQATP